MAIILRFNDLECLNEGAAGSLGAGLAAFARADFPTVRGFVVTPLVFSDFLKKEEIAAAIDLYKSGAEDPKESWKGVKAVFRRARIVWNHEMDILTAFRELNSTVSVVTTSKFGASASPVYASAGQDLLDGIKHCWLKWLKGNLEKLEQQDVPAVLVREIFDSETSMELRKKGQAIIARGVFGLPEGLNDSSISGDIYEFKPDDELERIEQRQQSYQYIMKAQGPAKIELDEEFQNEEKASGDMLASLLPLRMFIKENPGIERCCVCFVSSRPVVCSAMLVSERDDIKELPKREFSLSLMEQKKPTPISKIQHGPVVATKLFLSIEEPDDINRLGDEYIEGLIISKNIDDNDISQIISEAKRRFRTSQAVIELKNENLENTAGIMREIMGHEIEPGILIPGIRSSDELAKVINNLNMALEGLSPRPNLWVRIMYPSNLFFMDTLANRADVLALDLDMLGRLMLGGGEAGHWLIFSFQALEKALGEALASCSGKSSIAVLSEDLVAMPSLLEFLIRNGTEILCVKPGDVQTIRHIVASVEKRMLLEIGKLPGGGN